MSKSKPVPTREESIRMQPTIYTFNFRDTPTALYTKALQALFLNPDYAEAVEKRNRLVRSASRLRPNSSELRNLANTIVQKDRRLADILYATLVQTNVNSTETLNSISFDTLLKYYVDYSKEGMAELTEQLSTHLDSVTFLADMIESLIVDIKSEMVKIFNDDVEFQQFDGVSLALTQLRGFFKRMCSIDDNSPEAKLYFEYADSINDYMYKRLKTYTKKYRKLHPEPPVYTEADLMEGLNAFMGRDMPHHYIKHTNSGGAYIDVVALIPDLDEQHTALLDKTTEKLNASDTVDKTLKYNFALTDAIMKLCKEGQK